MTNKLVIMPIVLVLAGALAAAIGLTGCGEKTTPMDTNLLTNSSFEEIADGVPVGWEIRNFKGLDGDIPSEWGVDSERATDGQNSFFFQADAEARRFYLLTQRIEVTGVERVRIRGDIKALEVQRNPRQFPQANFAITCYDADGNRFHSSRFYDRRTDARLGTTDGWSTEERVFRIPDGTAAIEFHCVLGMEGKVWFDNVSLDVPMGLAWLTSESKNFTFHWLAGSEYPEGSKEYQQELFDLYCTRLGVPEEERPHVSTFLYPDSVTLFRWIGTRQPKKSFWDEKEVHSIFPVDDHEIIHIVTKPYGILPLPITEGTAFYLMGHYRGEPVLEVAQRLYLDGKLPNLQTMLTPGLMRRLNPDVVAPAAASFVGYLLELAGPEQFLALHREANAARNPEEFAEAFVRVYGVEIEKAEMEWLALLDRLDFSADADSTAAPSGAEQNLE
jgi:hypothetical protein